MRGGLLWLEAEGFEENMRGMVNSRPNPLSSKLRDILMMLVKKDDKD